MGLLNPAWVQSVIAKVEKVNCHSPVKINKP